MNLVFASGFLVPQHLLGINYFRDLDAHLKGSGHVAIFPDVPPLKTSADRAIVLANKIHTEFPGGAVHIIAHSMGGLDARTLIGGNLNGLSAPGRIASLTTLSTPHRGSPVADLLTTGPAPDVRGRLEFEVVSHAFGLLSMPIGALGDLTTAGAAQIPNVVKTHPHIRYRSHFAAGRPVFPPTCAMLAPTHLYIHSLKGQANDGLVTSDSARYGEFQEPAFECDHADLVGHNLDPVKFNKFQFDHLTAIDAMIAKLQQA